RADRFSRVFIKASEKLPAKRQKPVLRKDRRGAEWRKSGADNGQRARSMRIRRRRGKLLQARRRIFPTFSPKIVFLIFPPSLRSRNLVSHLSHAFYNSNSSPTCVW